MASTRFSRVPLIREPYQQSVLASRRPEHANTMHALREPKGGHPIHLGSKGSRRSNRCLGQGIRDENEEKERFYPQRGTRVGDLSDRHASDVRLSLRRFWVLPPSRPVSTARSVVRIVH